MQSRFQHKTPLKDTIRLVPWSLVQSTLWLHNINVAEVSTMNQMSNHTAQMMACIMPGRCQKVEELFKWHGQNLWTVGPYMN